MAALLVTPSLDLLAPKPEASAAAYFLVWDGSCWIQGYNPVLRCANVLLALDEDAILIKWWEQVEGYKAGRMEASTSGSLKTTGSLPPPPKFFWVLWIPGQQPTALPSGQANAPGKIVQLRVYLCGECSCGNAVEMLRIKRSTCSYSTERLSYWLKKRLGSKNWCLCLNLTCSSMYLKQVDWKVLNYETL